MKFCKWILIFAAVVFASETEPRVHHGFYRNLNLGYTHAAFEYTENNFEEYEKHREKTTANLNGINFFEVRYGVALKNFVAFYLAFGFDAMIGTSDWKESSLYNDGRVFSDSESEDVVFGYTFFGYGVTFYPFRDKIPSLNGAFVGVKVETYAGVFLEGRDTKGVGTLLFFELGKDWWVGNNTSIGVGASYGFALDYYDVGEINEERNVDMQIIRLEVRFTRG